MRLPHSTRTSGLIAFIGVLLFVSQALAEESSWLLDFEAENTFENNPSWLQPLPADKQKSFAEARFEISSPATATDLLLTINFTEKAGGFLKVVWTGPGGTQILSDNLYEGIGMPNQRRLLVSKMILKEKGILTFQSSQEDLQISRIQWDWLESKVVAATDEGFTVEAISNNGRILTGDEVSGDPPTPASDQWKGAYITAPLTENPGRLEQGTEFQAEFESAPTTSRLEGWFNGIDLDKNLTVWINGHSLACTPEIPDLSDSGYQLSAAGKPSYAGWRKVQLWIPPSWLQAGMNKIQFSWPDDSKESAPVSVKNLSLQLGFKSLTPPARPPLPVAPAGSSS